MKLRSGFAFPLTLACAAVLMTGCSQKSSDTSAVLAKVNHENITQAQLDYARKQITAARPGASAPSDAEILRGLVEQRLVVQKAEKEKLDRNPGVLQAIEATRKDALARFAVDEATAQVPKPSADDIQKYYDSHPENFSGRNIYLIQRVDTKLAPEQARALIASVNATSSAAEVVDVIKAKSPAANVTQLREPAESLGPLLAKFAVMKVGQTLTVQQAQGLISALTLLSVEPQPVTLAQSQASIEQLLWSQRKREALEAETKALRAVAKIEYLGTFAASAATASATPVSPVVAPDAASAASH